MLWTQLGSGPELELDQGVLASQMEGALEQSPAGAPHRAGCAPGARPPNLRRHQDPHDVYDSALATGASAVAGGEHPAGLIPSPMQPHHCTSPPLDERPLLHRLAELCTGSTAAHQSPSLSAQRQVPASAELQAGPAGHPLHPADAAMGSVAWGLAGHHALAGLRPRSGGHTSGQPGRGREIGWSTGLQSGAYAAGGQISFSSLAMPPADAPGDGSIGLEGSLGHAGPSFAAWGGASLPTGPRRGPSADGPWQAVGPPQPTAAATRAGPPIGQLPQIYPLSHVLDTLPVSSPRGHGVEPPGMLSRPLNGLLAPVHRSIDSVPASNPVTHSLYPAPGLQQPFSATDAPPRRSIGSIPDQEIRLVSMPRGPLGEPSAKRKRPIGRVPSWGQQAGYHPPLQEARLPGSHPGTHVCEADLSFALSRTTTRLPGNIGMLEEFAPQQPGPNAPANAPSPSLCPGALPATQIGMIPTSAPAGISLPGGPAQPSNAAAAPSVKGSVPTLVGVGAGHAATGPSPRPPACPDVSNVGGDASILSWEPVTRAANLARPQAHPAQAASPLQNGEQVLNKGERYILRSLIPDTAVEAISGLAPAVQGEHLLSFMQLLVSAMLCRLAKLWSRQCTPSPSCRGSPCHSLSYHP